MAVFLPPGNNPETGEPNDGAVIILGVYHQIQTYELPVYSPHKAGWNAMREQFARMLAQGCDAGYRLLLEEADWEWNDRTIAENIASCKNMLRVNIEMHPDIRRSRGIPIKYRSDNYCEWRYQKRFTEAEKQKWDREREAYFASNVIDCLGNHPGASAVVIVGESHAAAVGALISERVGVLDNMNVSALPWFDQNLLVDWG